MKTTDRKRRKTTRRAVMAWAEAELVRDPALAREVEGLLDEMRIAQDLATLREAGGLSQSQLAKRLGVSQPRIASIESGKAKNLELKTLVRYAAACGGRVRIAIERPRPRARAGASA